MTFVLGVVLFALGIGVSIALHEFGHLLTAKAFGMKATRYFVGFGPKIFSFRRGETEYGLKAIPAGGFVQIVGMTALEEVDREDEPRAFYNKPVWQRVIVLAAGSITHFLIGILVLFVMAVSIGLPNLDNKAIVGEVSACVPATPTQKECRPGDPAPARQAGLRPGDEILAVGGRSTPTYEDVLRTTREMSGPTPFRIRRDGQEQTLTVDVAKVQRAPLDAKAGDTQLVSVGAVGLSNSRLLQYGVLEAVPATLGLTGQMFENTWEGIKRLPQKVPAVWRAIMGENDPERPVSVVGASVIGGDAAERGLWELFLMLLAGLNFFVGVFNLLPLLPLDGGHIAVNVYGRVRDWVRRLRGLPAGAPVDYTKLLPITYVLMLLGGAMMLLTVTADIVNPIRLPQ
ncbi:RIP metalloprotease RseP [Streptoalloteichus tenebrarius]|uniref:RIP metalloprotease RseP n=1 Tax=Streptoalloteichus tenebrarius (strain ATCC 17920 / DSM 40477 / JCM 4838 / CBS 697.72 / NBRC 16177 / NCIMB 11028 / NRRL B-12390 / A12253. 1 / ISP 5477) TaxID=1933 RepID=A0ABT1HZ52_STRSD|nr:site-2 protease family protein [Streptoalloteichus tenebrarius]MCP2260776.1 RIP metalloprotease RseP [Streptoalloteichus tenebrarius]BFF03408.1 M50 family metallopeptidase [Streptoalloteichus tenebrarius]